MAPFRRGRSTDVVSRSRAPSADNMEAAWEARRRRKQNLNSSNNNNANNSNNRRDKNTKNNSNNRRKEDLPPDEYDPYDSDPGESYREHCERIKGDRLRSCLTMPRFLVQNKISDATEATSPPSPLEDVARAPPSLPKDLARVRYSLRTSISDGGQAQVAAPNLMERRDLRPNNVHINVSHWSDFGGRNYMEDR